MNEIHIRILFFKSRIESRTHNFFVVSEVGNTISGNIAQESK